ncbi:MAG: hypothetical protein JWO67_45 [Streptosporangiaceae bacterium]|nr:hypothetical protein [Streptosporangiaceae bacterium]
MTGPVPTPEEAYDGILLGLDAAAAATAHSWLVPDDFADPSLAAIHTLVGALAGQGIAPDPTSVLALARSSGMLTTADSIAALAMQLADLYGCTAVAANVRYYAVGALADAYRRRTAEMAARLEQIADHAELDELTRVRLHESAELDTLHARLVALQGDRQLRAVPAA